MFTAVWIRWEIIGIAKTSRSPEDKTFNKFAENLALPAIELASLTTGTGEIKYLLTRGAIVSKVDDLLQGTVKSIKALDQDAIVGYLGSLAAGQKYNTGGRFDPTDFDVDAFIVSDQLARNFPNSSLFRNGRKFKDIRELSNELENVFCSLSGYRKDTKKPFTFQIYSKQEFEAKIKSTGSKVVNPKI